MLVVVVAVMVRVADRRCFTLSMICALPPPTLSLSPPRPPVSFSLSPLGPAHSLYIPPSCFPHWRSHRLPRSSAGKVVSISNDISEALRLHTSSVPPGLSGHIVLVGDRARLEHYIFAMRRQRPHKPIVVVTEEKVHYWKQKM